jgi:hypothetical protein
MEGSDGDGDGGVELAGYGEQVAQALDVAVPDPAGVSPDQPEREGRELARLDPLTASSPRPLHLSPTGPGGDVGLQLSVVTRPAHQNSANCTAGADVERRRAGRAASGTGSRTVRSRAKLRPSRSPHRSIVAGHRATRGFNDLRPRRGQVTGPRPGA